MRKRQWMRCAPTCVLVLCGCASPHAVIQPVAVACPVLAAPPPELMETETPNLTQRVLARFLASRQTETGLRAK